MTSRQEKFARNVAKGMTQRAAYRDAYPNSRKWKDAAVDSQACILARNSEVSKRLAELRKANEDAARLTREKKLAIIEKDIENAIAQRDRYGMIALLKLHNDMTGDNAPAKTEVTVDILSAIVERHRNVIEEG